jgi:hypothetical protein
MSHQYKAGDVVTVFQISPANELVIEGKATIRKRVAEVDEQYRVEFANKPGVTCQRFVDSWGQDDPEKYVQEFNRRAIAARLNRLGKNCPNLWGVGGWGRGWGPGLPPMSLYPQ